MADSLRSDALWRHLESFAFEVAGNEFTFHERLARENRWDAWYAVRVVEEYLRFLYLLGRAGHPVTPSIPVDQAWHLHLTYSRNYWDELAPAFDSPPHHGPTRGGDAENARYDTWYRNTLASYRRVFGHDAPAHIWAAPEERFRAQQRWVWVDASRHRITPLSAVGRFR